METKKKKITLFKNKSENANAPVLTGFISIENNKIEKISLWEKTAESGIKYYFGDITEIEFKTTD
jgi:hypothetical protein